MRIRLDFWEVFVGGARPDGSQYEVPGPLELLEAGVDRPTGTQCAYNSRGAPGQKLKSSLNALRRVSRLGIASWARGPSCRSTFVVLRYVKDIIH